MLPGQTLPPLAHVNVRVSGVVPSPLAEVWKVVRGFGTVAQWMAPIGLERITSDLLPGSIEGQLGALRRMCFGEMGFVEQLDGLDDDDHLIKWRVISHPLNTNPFPGSFLNYKAKIRLHDVTISNVTFLEIQAEFDTEHMSAEVMRRELTARHEASVRGLLTLLTAKAAAVQQQVAAQTVLASLPLASGGYQYYVQGGSNSRSGGGGIPVPVPVQLPGGGIASLPLSHSGGVVLPNGQIALGASNSRSGGGIPVPVQLPGGGIASLPLSSAPIVLPNGQIALVPAMAKMGLSTASLPNSLHNSLGNSGGPDLSANLATSRVLASNNLAAQQAPPLSALPMPAAPISSLPMQALAEASAALHHQHLAAQAQLVGGGGVLPGGIPTVLPGGVSTVLSGGGVPTMLSGGVPMAMSNSGGGGLVPGIIPGVSLPGSLPGVMPGVLPGGLPTSVHPILAAQVAASMQQTPVLSAGGLVAPRDLRTMNSNTSYCSNDSFGSVRGNSYAKALQQVQAGALPPDAQAAAMQVLQRHMDARASLDSNDPRMRPELLVNNSGGSAASFAAASPPRLSPRFIEKASSVPGGSEAIASASLGTSAALGGISRVLSS